MQIATSLFYDRSTKAMAQLTAQADKVQTQISSTKKFTAASSDSAAYQRLAGLKRDASNDVAYQANLTTASSVLQQADTTLSAITAQLQRASELVVRANTGTMNADDRKAMGVELASIVESLADLANTKDLRGQPLFGGADGGAGVTKQADGSYVLASTPISAIPIGDGDTVQANETASRVFKIGDSDAFTMLSAIADSLQSDTATTDSLSGAIADIKTASDQVSTVQASLGARASRVDLEQTRLKDVATDRDETRSAIEDTDVPTAVIELQKTMTILSATQASFTKLAQLSLFDYLR